MSPRQGCPPAWHVADFYSEIRIAGLLSLALDPNDPVRKSIFQKLCRNRKRVTARDGRPRNFVGTCLCAKNEKIHELGLTKAGVTGRERAGTRRKRQNLL